MGTDAVRPDVHRLVRLGRMSPSGEADEGVVEAYERLLSRVERPVTDAEARMLVGLFGEDDFFGLAWTLIHLVESAPGWPLNDCLSGDNVWVTLLRQRQANARLYGRSRSAGNLGELR